MRAYFSSFSVPSISTERDVLLIKQLLVRPDKKTTTYFRVAELTPLFRDAEPKQLLSIAMACSLSRRWVGV